jgi:hypothetical protein
VLVTQRNFCNECKISYVLAYEMECMLHERNVWPLSHNDVRFCPVMHTALYHQLSVHAARVPVCDPSIAVAHIASSPQWSLARQDCLLGRRPNRQQTGSCLYLFLPKRRLSTGAGRVPRLCTQLWHTAACFFHSFQCRLKLRRYPTVGYTKLSSGLYIIKPAVCTAQLITPSFMQDTYDAFALQCDTAASGKGERIARGCGMCFAALVLLMASRLILTAASMSGVGLKRSLLIGRLPGSDRRILTTGQCVDA